MSDGLFSLHWKIHGGRIMYEKQRQLCHGSIYKLVPEEVIKEVCESTMMRSICYLH